ncbi:PH domain-containing protein [Candidatus Saccharibacteria bacterium]|nr:PH domain-containing protein [Candidatus Saccharibacteria bacterium]MBR3253471.1 PH domain-containing protein [Candidatus Saccharibacteria bacterium]
MDNNLAKIRHERSVKDFPGLKLEDDEYVEFAFSRAKICLLMILGGIAGGLILILLAFLVVLLGQQMIDEMGKHFLFIILFALLAAAIIIGAIALRIYKGNKLFITNKHAIQLVMDSLVSDSINIIDLASVEDASLRQDSLLQKIFHYGTFRLSTVGDETTYTFKYSDVSSSELKAVIKLITDAKKISRKSKDNN